MKRILGLDVGTKRTGIAVSDPLGLTAQAVETWEHVSRNADLERMAEWAHHYDVAKIVVGLPKNMNGTLGERAEKTQKFAARLQRLLPETEIVFWDERLTTVAAQRSLLAGAYIARVFECHRAERRGRQWKSNRNRNCIMMKK